jgi:hypothetical protein
MHTWPPKYNNGLDMDKKKEAQRPNLPPGIDPATSISGLRRSSLFSCWAPNEWREMLLVRALKNQSIKSGLAKIERPGFEYYGV